jgi:NAD(P)-dependent dehydrogenase (short-subunit alcohol dehydrogenase family)
MSFYRDKVAIVTGGASGIGRALCQELGRRGACVVIADVNAAGAEQVASGIATARAVYLDVSRAWDVQELVKRTTSEHGRLDLMFNNAGIAIVGEARDLDLAHWQRVFDVNLWGVIHGTTSAYQVMAQQGHGHIVNIASASGLVPTPMLAAYTTSKHAVVGLSTSLRAEAADLGVKVSVACPGLVQTGLVYTTQLVNLDRESLIPLLGRMGFMDPAKCARAILRGVARNKAIIPVPASARFLWWLQRLHPDLLTLLTRKVVALCRSSVRSES